MRSSLSVEIVQYPNDAWARYELRFRNGDQGVGDEINVKTVWTLDRPVFVIGSKAFWSSGDKVIVISGNAPPAILDAFINAYLQRYPNTLEHDFDLPYLPQR